MSNQKTLFAVFAVVVVICVAVALWSFRRAGSPSMKPEEVRAPDAVSQQMAPVLNNPNIPPQARQWMEYNLQQQRARTGGQ